MSRPTKTYQIIYADPPWKLQAGPRSLHEKNEGSRPLAYSFENSGADAYTADSAMTRVQEKEAFERFFDFVMKRLEILACPRFGKHRVRGLFWNRR